MSRPVAFALAAHPDDIDLMMAGTLLLLGEAGYELHYMNLASGSCGTATLSAEEIVAVRTGESQDAARTLGATWHAPLVDDLEILYELPTLRRLTATMREVEPEILLLQSPQDYMEDHTNACRLGASAAFIRGMRNWVSDPPVAPTAQQVAVYHALPWGLLDPLMKPVHPQFVVDIANVLARKTEVLACHRSQKEWLDVSQGLDSYLTTMHGMAEKVGAPFGLSSAEGWRRHLPLGYCDEDFDPLRATLAELVRDNPAY